MLEASPETCGSQSICMRFACNCAAQYLARAPALFIWACPAGACETLLRASRDWRAPKQRPSVSPPAAPNQVAPSNIAEGCGRNGEKELGRFFSIAAGSASELDYSASAGGYSAGDTVAPRWLYSDETWSLANRKQLPRENRWRDRVPPERVRERPSNTRSARVAHRSPRPPDIFRTFTFNFLPMPGASPKPCSALARLRVAGGDGRGLSRPALAVRAARAVPPPAASAAATTPLR